MRTKLFLLCCIIMLPTVGFIRTQQPTVKHYKLIMFTAPAEVDNTPFWLSKINEGQQIAAARAQQEALAAAELAKARSKRKSKTNYSTGTAPGGAWNCIRNKESGNNYSDGNGGAYQFLDSTWDSMDGKKGNGYDGVSSAQEATPEQQDAAAIKLQQRSGWGQWTTAGRCGV